MPIETSAKVLPSCVITQFEIRAQRVKVKLAEVRGQPQTDLINSDTDCN